MISRILAAATLASVAAAPLAAQDFSSFNLGSIDQQQGWTTRDAFTSCTTINTTWNQAIKDVNGVRVWQLSNAVTSGTYSSKPFSPVTAQVAGETGASLWNNRGTNGCSPTAVQFGANATTNRFYHSTTFRSATGAPQPGLFVTLSPSAKQATVRMSWLQLKDNGSTGIDLLFYDLAPSASSTGQFVAATTIATGLSYTDAHTVSMTIDFVDGVTDNGGMISGNDVVKIHLNGSLIHTGSTWESYYYFSEQIVAGTPRKQAVNAMLYNVSGTAAPATAGNGFHFLAMTTGNTPPNTAPVAVDDSYSMLRGAMLNVAAPGVIGNDTDAENNSLTATLVGNPSNGNVIVYGDGSFDYTPAPAFAGTDSFTYKVSDGVADSNTATVTITVDNLAPVAVADSYTMDEDAVLTVAAPGVLGNDSDGNSDPIQSVQLTSAANGNVALLIDGSFTYTPAANFFGTDSFTYKVTDGLLESAPVTVTITVNDVPDLIPVNSTGFFQPVDNLPTINRARAGRTVPLKFRVTNGSGVGIQVPGLAVAVTSALATSNVATEDAIETYTGNSGLQYLGDGYYQWNWATLSGYVNQTRRLTLSINAAGYSFSQAQLQADFRFTK